MGSVYEMDETYCIFRHHNRSRHYSLLCERDQAIQRSRIHVSCRMDETFPYVAMFIALIASWQKQRLFVSWSAAAVLVSAGGVLYLTDVIYWHSDAQGAIQVAVLAILLPLASLLSRNSRA
jgi:hypothetical protein